MAKTHNTQNNLSIFAHSNPRRINMKDVITSGIIGIGIGMVIGGIIVAKNKKLAGKIDKGTDKITNAFEEIKTDAKEKIEHAKQKNQNKKKEK